MPGEELIQRGYIRAGQIKGTRFGSYEELNLGQTTVGELKRAGVIAALPGAIAFPFQYYRPPKKTTSVKPDIIYLNRIRGALSVVACVEMKQPNEFNTEKKRLRASEQALTSAWALNGLVAVASDGSTYLYYDVQLSLLEKRLVRIDEGRDLNPAVLQELTAPNHGQNTQLGPLVAKVWQAIWHATKEEPKPCLMTFVEIFILKFLSDNLSADVLPRNYTFYELTNRDERAFREAFGKTQIEYYVDDIRPKIKSIFRDKTVIESPTLKSLLGLETIVSTTSVINGFAFLKSGSVSLVSFNRTFMEILGYFHELGALTHIDPEFKLRLYETFLKKTVGQQKLGQFFTPRNVVRSMITMANLADLPDGSVVLDPAAGVGGFVLEPLIQKDALERNITFSNGLPQQRVRLLGCDVEATPIILAKANTLIHLAEYVRDPKVSIEGLNKLMAELFLLLNTNQHLGTLEYPIRNKVDVILTNPPYVTKGSRIYKEEIQNVQGLRNGVDLREYYERCGLGLESLFLRYISGALKPGGRAFVIVPQGLLTRTESSLKERILAECNLLASICLPRNTFFNTPQKTYIIALAKRRTHKDSRPDVFCAIASSVGETLDARRVPTPDDNTLDDIGRAFSDYSRRSKLPGDDVNKRIRIVSAERFTELDRWDVPSGVMHK